MQDFKNKRILIGVCGGIAAYKIAYLVRDLVQLGAEVQIVMTRAAEAFITPLTLQALSGRSVRMALFDESAEQGMGHIELARWADYCVVAPATANMIAKLAHGIADDLLSTLALVLKAPMLVCPAMNQSMWHHPATQANLEILRKRGVCVVGPRAGLQACGDNGLGCMTEPSDIVNALRLRPWEYPSLLLGQQVLITAGPTREAIDPVRYLSNQSSGKMGYALAYAAAMAGAQVTLVSGPTALSVPDQVHYLKVDTAVDMYHAVMQSLLPGALFIGAAAVSDYAPDSVSNTKLKKDLHPVLSLPLKQNPDILAAVAATQKAKYVVGFAAETNDLIQHAMNKLYRKQIDCVVANWVGAQQGFDCDENAVTVLTRANQIVLAKTHKIRLAGQLLAIFASSLQNNAHGTQILQTSDAAEHSS